MKRKTPVKKIDNGNIKELIREYLLVDLKTQEMIININITAICKWGFKIRKK